MGASSSQPQPQQPQSQTTTTTPSKTFASILKTLKDQLQEDKPSPQLLHVLETLDESTKGIMFNTDDALRLYNRLFLDTSKKEDGDLEKLQTVLGKLELNLAHFNTVENSLSEPAQSGGAKRKKHAQPQSPPRSTIFILGRRRRVYRNGRAQCIQYKGRAMSLTEAKKLAKKLGR
jgi:hypothetical protein